MNISENLGEWLKVCRGSPIAFTWRLWNRFLAATGWMKNGRSTWPQNAMRHSCASYMLAANQSADKTALQLGHTPQMLFQHYRELVTPDQAREYWAIRP